MFFFYANKKDNSFYLCSPDLSIKIQYNDKKTYQHDCFKRHHLGFMHLQA